MTHRGSRALVALALLACPARVAMAQDTTAAPLPPHQLAIDTARLRPYHRSYDISVRRGDSSTVIGVRDVELILSTYSGNPAWVLVESRTGSVPGVDSIVFAPDFRPRHWTSAQGLARLGFEFAGDSIYGAVTGPAVRQNVVMAGRRDLLVSSAMVETVLQTLPLAPAWSDSASVLEVDATGARVVPAEITVVGEEEIASDSSTARAAWVISVRSEGAHALYWVDKSDGAILRLLQPLQPHAGSDIEFKLRPNVVGAMAPSSPTPP